MVTKLKYGVVDVFTTTRFEGNPLAIVHVPSHDTLTQTQKQTIAKEFNFSETVFIYHLDKQPDSSSGQYMFPISIFTPNIELRFAGHPIIGTGYYLTSGLAGINIPEDAEVILRAKAGDIVISRGEGGKVEAEVTDSFDFKRHPPVFSDIKAPQTELKEEDWINPLDFKEAVVSVAKGTNFFMVPVATKEALDKLSTYGTHPSLPKGHLGEYANTPNNDFAFVFLYFVDPATSTTNFKRVYARMFFDGIEDPATGSAVCGLLAHIAEGKGVSEVHVTQGEKMGRRSEIFAEVRVGEEGKIEKIALKGEAVGVMEGILSL